jgi:hypothetical protein
MAPVGSREHVRVSVTIQVDGIDVDRLIRVGRDYLLGPKILAQGRGSDEGRRGERKQTAKG